MVIERREAPAPSQVPAQAPNQTQVPNETKPQGIDAPAQAADTQAQAPQDKTAASSNVIDLNARRNHNQ